MGQPVKIVLISARGEDPEAFKNLLANKKLVLSSFHDGKQAIAKLDHELPQIIMVDEEIANGAPLECCKAIKANATWRSVPMILTLSPSYMKLANSFYEADVDLILEKPLQKDLLLNKIFELSGGSQRRFHRANLTSSVKIQSGDKSVIARGINLNPEFILVATNQPFSENKNYRLTFRLDSQRGPIQSWARFCRKTEQDGETQVLFRFLGLTQYDAQRLENFLRARPQPSILRSVFSKKVVVALLALSATLPIIYYFLHHLK